MYNFKTTKEIWETLEVTHEGSEEVNRSKLNTLSQEYEIFRMQPEEKILYFPKRFTHLTNHLMELEKKFTYGELNFKVLISLTITWQLNVMDISKKKILSKISSTTLFKKFQEHDLELERL